MFFARIVYAKARTRALQRTAPGRLRLSRLLLPADPPRSSRATLRRPSAVSELESFDKQMKRVTTSLLVLITLFLGVIAAYLISIRPWQSKVLSHGYSPDGREYCVVQTFRDLVEPYQVSFYVRDADGIWRWNYLEHEDFGWKSASVTFSGGSAKVARNGMPFKEIVLPTDHVDLPNVLEGYRDRYCASEFSVEDVFAFHNQNYR